MLPPGKLRQRGPLLDPLNKHQSSDLDHHPGKLHIRGPQVSSAKQNSKSQISRSYINQQGRGPKHTPCISTIRRKRDKITTGAGLGEQPTHTRRPKSSPSFDFVMALLFSSPPFFSGYKFYEKKGFFLNLV